MDIRSGGSGFRVGAGCLALPIVIAAAMAGMEELDDSDYDDAAILTAIALLLPLILVMFLPLAGADTDAGNGPAALIAYILVSTGLATLGWKYACRRSWWQSFLGAAYTIIPLLILGMIRVGLSRY